MKIRYRFAEDAGGVTFTADHGGAVHVDARDHVVRLRSSRGATAELGALRAGLWSAMGFLVEELGIPALQYDLTPSSAAIERALGDAARKEGVRDESLEASVFSIMRTPLLWSAPFLTARFVWQDALRFRACRVAVANAEDDLIDDDTPAAAVAVVERLGHWRELFASVDAGGRRASSKRALNAALHDYGETMPAQALWGLRKVPLSRPRDRREPLELLGWLGALPPADGIDAVIDVVERAGDAEILAALEKVEPRLLAQRLADGDPGSRTFLQLLRSVAERIDEEQERRATKDGDFARPPIAPPEVQEGRLRLIGSSAELRAEGEQMHHCVYGLRRRCRRGEAYVFHAELGGAHGTIHVDRAGRVVEARGPCNRSSLAAAWGASALAQWGVGLWANLFSLDALAWPVTLSPALVRPEHKPLRNVRAIIAAFHRMSSPQPRLRDWFVTMTEHALAGGVGLALVEDAAGAAVDVVALDAVNGAALQYALRGGITAPRAMRGLWRERNLPIVLDRRGRDVPLERLGPAAALMPAVDLDVTPPIPPPRMQGLSLVRKNADFRAVRDDYPAHIGVDVADLAAGRVFLLRYAPGRGEVLLRVDAATREIVCTNHRSVSQDEIDEALARARIWAHGFWVVDVAAAHGMERSTWRSAGSAPVAPPPSTTPLTTVAQCSAAYQTLAEQAGDRDGKLAAFFQKHVALAARGSCFLVVREGVVLVLDKKRSILARSDRL